MPAAERGEAMTGLSIRLRPVAEEDLVMFRRFAIEPENIAEQKSLVRAGFQLEGVVRACEFRDGRWCDGYLYSRLRDDPSPLPPRSA
jgi:hypothetical protein